MGFRYRKSINLGGGFRINLSKSGTGYSWGVKGYRVTKTAKGTTRATLSIPGTGISFVDETGKKNTKSKQEILSPSSGNIYGTEKIENQNISGMVAPELEDVISAAKKALQLDINANIFMIVFLILSFCNIFFMVPLACSLGLKIYVRKSGKVNLVYTIDEFQQKNVAARMAQILKAIKSEKVWCITESSKVKNTKYSAGASNLIGRSICKAKTRPPFPFLTNTPALSLQLRKETLIFLPDKLFVIQGSKVGALCYDDITITVETTRFVEREKPPRDAKIVGKTWMYVNKSGGPDKRFKQNRELPVCLYGQIRLKSPSGLNTLLMFSNPTSAQN